MIVYCTNWHDENGPLDLRVNLSIESLMETIRTHYVDDLVEAEAMIAENNGALPVGYGRTFGKGWGGLQLLVVDAT